MRVGEHLQHVCMLLKTPNPFFGTRPIKKSTPVNVKDDFNPFKHNKVVEVSQVCTFSILFSPFLGSQF